MIHIFLVIYQTVKTFHLPLMQMTACWAVGLSMPANAWLPGTYPVAPQRMHSTGFVVNNFDRNDVVAFWHSVYLASEGYETRVGWTGNYTGNEGAVSPVFAADVERRINYFRAMSGIYSASRVNTGSTVEISPGDLITPPASTLKSVAAQKAALMLVRNYNATTGENPALTHFPSYTLTGWSPMAWNASAKGNFAFGLYGPGAITEYMLEQFSSSSSTSTWNSLVGHRRWILYPPATDFATGDQPGTTASQPPTNVLYVSQKPSELLPITPSMFVAYPPAGFFPAQINSRFWSVSHRDGDFSRATVSMVDAAGSPLAVANVRVSLEYGDPALVWEVPAAASVASVFNDTTFHVTVTGIGGRLVPTMHQYPVTLINPDRIVSNETMAGAPSVKASQSSTYTFTPPTGAEEVLVIAAVLKPAAFTESAEKASAAKVVDGTAASYPLIVKTASFAGFGNLTGTSAFRLTFPKSYDLVKREVPQQYFELNREIVANSLAKLKFQIRRGYMTRTTALAVEASSNGGVTWKILGQPIKGVSDTKYDAAASLQTRPLPKSATPLRIRFRFYTTGGSIYTHEAAPTSPTGIFVDQISTANCSTVETKRTSSLGAMANNFVFNSSSAGANLVAKDIWYLRLRTKLGGKWFPHGPVKAVAIAAP